MGGALGTLVSNRSFKQTAEETRFARRIIEKADDECAENTTGNINLFHLSFFPL